MVLFIIPDFLTPKIHYSFSFKPIITHYSLEIRKSQDLAKDLGGGGGTASKAEKKICQSKIVSYI